MTWLGSVVDFIQRRTKISNFRSATVLLQFPDTPPQHQAPGESEGPKLKVHPGRTKTQRNANEGKVNKGSVLRLKLIAGLL